MKILNVYLSCQTYLWAEGQIGDISDTIFNEMYPEIFSALKGKVEICCKLSLASNFNSDTDNDRVCTDFTPNKDK